MALNHGGRHNSHNSIGTWTEAFCPTPYCSSVYLLWGNVWLSYAYLCGRRWISPSNTTHFHVLSAHFPRWIQVMKHHRLTMTTATNAAVSPSLPPRIPPPSTVSLAHAILHLLPPPPLNQTVNHQMTTASQPAHSPKIHLSSHLVLLNYRLLSPQPSPPLRSRSIQRLFWLWISWLLSMKSSHLDEIQITIRAISDFYNIDEPRDFQIQAIHYLAFHDNPSSILLRRRADGKSLVLLTTSILRCGITRVLVPLHGLRNDRVDKATVFDHGASYVMLSGSLARRQTMFWLGLRWNPAKSVIELGEDKLKEQPRNNYGTAILGLLQKEQCWIMLNGIQLNNQPSNETYYHQVPFPWIKLDCLSTNMVHRNNYTTTKILLDIIIKEVQ